MLSSTQDANSIHPALREERTPKLTSCGIALQLVLHLGIVLVTHWTLVEDSRALQVFIHLSSGFRRWLFGTSLCFVRRALSHS